ncbi:MAG: hypothetical protein V4576_02395, partial [Patescibacteria group bacterium]
IGRTPGASGKAGTAPPSIRSKLATKWFSNSFNLMETKTHSFLIRDSVQPIRVPIIVIGQDPHHRRSAAIQQVILLTVKEFGDRTLVFEEIGGTFMASRFKQAE